MLNRIRQSRIRYVIPSAITFTSLACGITAVLLAMEGNLTAAGVLILTSYVLDLFDGEAARRLDAGTEFGLQLDSLADLISLGMAPALLAFIHLRTGGHVSMAPVWPLIVFYVLAGAFRLARFNLLPTKEGQTDSVGLTISTAGATLTLAVLTDVANSQEVLHDLFFLPLLFGLALLMVSRISHPSITWIFSFRWANLVYLISLAAGLLWLRLSFFHVWFLFNSSYLGVALARAGYRAFEE
ncbi:MAG: CDP-alcohol phosphatidyltransferase family protein [Candidatus Promineifilaceae bacterium]|nr:CDP-alcohol phosphatidyltransferase family protein [Candidatus Promineifilaceae bacterium]